MKNNLLSIMMFIPLFFSGCKHDDDENKCVGGTGGTLTIIAQTIHHTRPIQGCTLYVKYNASEFPGDSSLSSFDVSYKIPDDTFKIAVSDLKCGSYYFYATGIDSTLSPVDDVWKVKGGISYSTDLQDTIITITVPVTEGD